MRYRLFAPAGLLLGAALTGCSSLPPDTGHAEVAVMLEMRGQTSAAIDDPHAATPLIAELAERPLTAEDAIRLALLNNPQLAAEYARLGLAAADVYEAGRLANPVLSASLLVPDAGHESNQVGFGLVQNFTSLLLMPSRSRLAEGEYRRAQQSIGAAALEIAAQTESAWTRLVGSWQLLGMREAIANAAAASATLAERFFAAGNINRLELALQQAAAAEARLAVLEVRAELTQQRSALNRLMGLAATEDRWKVMDRLPAPLAEEDPPAALLALADANRLDLAAARARVTLRADALGVTRSFRLLGEFEVGVETERETDRVRLTGPTASLELPLFDQGQGRVARAEALLEEAEAELRALEIAIGNRVAQASARVGAAKTRASLYRETLIPLREAIVAHTQEEVNFMLEGQFQLLQVKQQEYEAYQGYLEAVRDYWLARVELAEAVGTALPSSAHVGESTLDAESLLQPKGADTNDHGAHHGDTP